MIRGASALAVCGSIAIHAALVGAMCVFAPPRTSSDATGGINPALQLSVVPGVSPMGPSAVISPPPSGETRPILAQAPVVTEPADDSAYKPGAVIPASPGRNRDSAMASAVNPILKGGSQRRSASLARQQGGRIAERFSGSGMGTSAPRYLFNPPPAYPDAASAQKLSGVTILTVVVNAEGRAQMIAIAHSSGFGVLDRAAASAVHAWKFQPANANGVSVSWKIEIPIRFKLAGKFNMGSS